MTITVNIFPLHAIKCTILPLSLGPNVDAFIFVRLFFKLFLLLYCISPMRGSLLLWPHCSQVSQIFPWSWNILGLLQVINSGLSPYHILNQSFGADFTVILQGVKKKVIDKPCPQSQSSQIPKPQNQGTWAVSIISWVTHNINQSSNI